MSSAPASSALEVTGTDLVYSEPPGTELWRLAIADILLIVEYTTTDESVDDYFLAFGTICDGEPCLTECPTPGDVEICFGELGRLLGSPLKLKLFAVTEFASRVVWPPKLAGKPVFVLRETAQHVGLARLKRKIFGGETEWIVSAEVFEAMRVAG